MRTYTQEGKQAVIARVISGETSARILADCGASLRSLLLPLAALATSPGTLRVPRVPSSLTKRNAPTFVGAFLLAGAEGFEPSARGFGDRCSTN